MNPITMQKATGNRSEILLVNYYSINVKLILFEKCTILKSLVGNSGSKKEDNGAKNTCIDCFLLFLER